MLELFRSLNPIFSYRSPSIIIFVLTRSIIASTEYGVQVIAKAATMLTSNVVIELFDVVSVINRCR